MFRNAYQGGNSVEVFTSAGKNPAQEWKISGNVQRQYDKTVKGYVFGIGGNYSSKMQIPKTSSTTLGLTQRFLCLQLQITPTQAEAAGGGGGTLLEVAVLDGARPAPGRRRLAFGPAFAAVRASPLHAQVPLPLPRGRWLTLVLDLERLVAELFRAPEGYRSLDSLAVGAGCRLRRVFTLRDPPPERGVDPVCCRPAYADAAAAAAAPLPKQHAFPAGLDPEPACWVFRLGQEMVLSEGEGGGGGEGGAAAAATATARGRRGPSEYGAFSFKKGAGRRPVPLRKPAAPAAAAAATPASAAPAVGERRRAKAAGRGGGGSGGGGRSIAVAGVGTPSSSSSARDRLRALNAARSSPRRNGREGSSVSSTGSRPSAPSTKPTAPNPDAAVSGKGAVVREERRIGGSEVSTKAVGATRTDVAARALAAFGIISGSNNQFQPTSISSRDDNNDQEESLKAGNKPSRVISSHQYASSHTESIRRSAYSHNHPEDSDVDGERLFTRTRSQGPEEEEDEEEDHYTWRRRSQQEPRPGELVVGSAGGEGEGSRRGSGDGGREGLEEEEEDEDGEEEVFASRDFGSPARAAAAALRRQQRRPSAQRAEEEEEEEEEGRDGRSCSSSSMRLFRRRLAAAGGGGGSEFEYLEEQSVRSADSSKGQVGLFSDLMRKSATISARSPRADAEVSASTESEVNALLAMLNTNGPPGSSRQNRGEASGEAAPSPAQTKMKTNTQNRSQQMGSIKQSALSGADLSVAESLRQSQLREILFSPEGSRREGGRRRLWQSSSRTGGGDEEEGTRRSSPSGGSHYSVSLRESSSTLGRSSLLRAAASHREHGPAAAAGAPASPPPGELSGASASALEDGEGGAWGAAEEGGGGGGGGGANPWAAAGGGAGVRSPGGEGSGGGGAGEGAFPTLSGAHRAAAAAGLSSSTPLRSPHQRRGVLGELGSPSQRAQRASSIWGPSPSPPAPAEAFPYRRSVADERGSGEEEEGGERRTGNHRRSTLGGLGGGRRFVDDPLLEERPGDDTDGGDGGGGGGGCAAPALSVESLAHRSDRLLHSPQQASFLSSHKEEDLTEHFAADNSDNGGNEDVLEDIDGSIVENGPNYDIMENMDDEASDTGNSQINEEDVSKKNDHIPSMLVESLSHRSERILQSPQQARFLASHKEEAHESFGVGDDEEQDMVDDSSLGEGVKSSNKLLESLKTSTVSMMRTSRTLFSEDDLSPKEEDDFVLAASVSGRRSLLPPPPRPAAAAAAARGRSAGAASSAATRYGGGAGEGEGGGSGEGSRGGLAAAIERQRRELAELEESYLNDDDDDSATKSVQQVHVVPGGALSSLERQKMELMMLEESFKDEFGTLRHNGQPVRTSQGTQQQELFQEDDLGEISQDLDHYETQRSMKRSHQHCPPDGPDDSVLLATQGFDPPVAAAAFAVRETAASWARLDGGGGGSDEARASVAATPSAGKKKGEEGGVRASVITDGGRGGTEEVQGEGAGEEEGGDEIELMYDPVLNCYYDPKTDKYYELK